MPLPIRGLPHTPKPNCNTNMYDHHISEIGKHMHLLSDKYESMYLKITRMPKQVVDVGSICGFISVLEFHLGVGMPYAMNVLSNYTMLYLKDSF